MIWDALMKDGQKLRQLTGKDHGPWICPVCKDTGFMETGSGYGDVCPECAGASRWRDQS